MASYIQIQVFDSLVKEGWKVPKIPKNIDFGLMPFGICEILDPDGIAHLIHADGTLVEGSLPWDDYCLNGQAEW